MEENAEDVSVTEEAWYQDISPESTRRSLGERAIKVSRRASSLRIADGECGKVQFV